MTAADTAFHQIAAEIPDVTESKMFGALCIKAPNGKAGVMYKTGDDLVFKLPEPHLTEALALEGAHLFDPMGGRPMGGWVQLSTLHQSLWPTYGRIALEAVKLLEGKKK